jgi:O-antigen ligase
VRAVVNVLVALGIVIAVFGIAQKALVGDDFRVKIYGFWQPRYRNSPFGPFANRNHFAGWMLMVLPLALAYFASALHHALGTAGSGWRNKVLWLGSERAGQAVVLGFAVVVMAVSMVYSNSRSGLVCALPAVALIGWLAVRARIARSARILVGAVFMLLIASALVWAGSDVILHRFTVVPAEIGDRLGAWRDALHVVHDFPLTGIGLNAYGTASIEYQTVASAWQYTTAHNDYLQLAAEGGLLVGVPIVLAVVAFVRLMRRRWRQGDDDPTVSWLRAGAFVSLGAIALQALVDFSLQIPANAILFVVVAAIAVHRPTR